MNPYPRMLVIVNLSNPLVLKTVWWNHLVFGKFVDTETWTNDQVQEMTNEA